MQGSTNRNVAGIPVEYKGTNHVQLLMSQFFPYYIKFPQIVCLLDAGLEISKCIIILLSECSIVFSKIEAGFSFL